ncbi:MAG: PIG-L family deacetylase [SAR202 cluster bacterium]|nr:PIG-L family deacetylase [SAR202 cluster bacterium]
MTTQQQEHLGHGNKFMVVVAHPDDAEFMCSGTVARWTREGKDGVYVLVTSGDKGSSDPNVVPAELARTREEEQRNAARVLGVHTVEFLRYEDGMVWNTIQLRKDIVRMIRKHRPSAVITENPMARWVNNRVNHPDHRAVGDATMDAVFPSARDYHMFPELVRDEGLQPHTVDHLYISARGADADVYIDIATTIETKIRALRAHASQVRNPTPEFDENIRQMARRAAGESGMEFAESFKYFYLGPRLAPANTPIRA